MSEMVETQLSAIPILPLRDVVVYPHMVIPLFVGREKSIQALEAAMDNDKQILLVAQKRYKSKILILKKKKKLLNLHSLICGMP